MAVVPDRRSRAVRDDRFWGLTTLALLTTLLCTPALAAPKIVAAELVYGEIARQVAGPDAEITSILTNPDQDPHLFEAAPSTAQALAGADIVIVNGAGYDPWATKLLKGSPSKSRVLIDVAKLGGVKEGQNPHVWYDPKLAAKLAQELERRLAARDPAGAVGYADRDAAFQAALKPLQARIDAARARYAGAQVTATEPVFGYMAEALGLAMRNERFQLAVMNGTEPSAADTARFETDLRQRKVRLLFYNSQTSDAAAQRLLDIAKASGVPVVGVTETEPAGQSYVEWLGAELDATVAALGG